MYLIGCRDVQEFQRSSNDSRNLGGGLDCLTDIKIQYSPKNARWLLNPNIKFSINSRRSKDDDLYFRPLSINTFVLSYQKKFEDVIIRKGVEEVLRILLLVISIFCIRGQIRCTENQEHPTADISLVTLGLHALYFSIRLITGGEALLKWKEFTSYKDDRYQLQKLPLFQTLDCCIKILLLFALLEAVKLLQNVWESRKTQNSHAKKLNMRIPSDKIVFFFTVLIHITGFSICHSLRQRYQIPPLFQSQKYAFADPYIKRLIIWCREMEIYGGLVEDFFLLPQIIGNALWGVQGKPMRKLYYVAFTVIRLVLQAYDYARDPVPNPNHSEIEFQYLGVEFYDKLGNIIISVIVVTLAVTVCIQQNTAYQKSRQMKKLEECEDLDFKSNSHQRLLSE